MAAVVGRIRQFPWQSWVYFGSYGHYGRYKDITVCVSYHGNHRGTLVSMVTMRVLRLLCLPLQLQRYFRFYGNHEDTLIAMITVAALKIVWLPQHYGGTLGFHVTIGSTLISMVTLITVEIFVLCFLWHPQEYSYIDCYGNHELLVPSATTEIPSSDWWGHEDVIQKLQTICNFFVISILEPYFYIFLVRCQSIYTKNAIKIII